MVIELSQVQAEKLGIVRCACGCAINNHFKFPHATLRPCAHCPCEDYEQVIVLPKNEESK